MAQKKKENEQEKTSDGNGTKKHSKRTTITTASVVIAIIVVILLWGLAPDDYLEVSDVSKDPKKYLDKDIEIKGIVSDHDESNGSFILEEGKYELLVYYSKALPSNFEVGKDVVVKGHLEKSEHPLEDDFIFIAEEVIVGCASKYQ